MSEKRLWRPRTRIINWLVSIAATAGLGQWSFYGIFRCPFIVPYINCQNCPVITCHGRIFTLFWGFWIGWIALALLCGRAFCGWFCPGGLVNRLFSAFAPRRRQAGLTEKACSWGKLLGLLLVVWVIWMLNQPRVNVPIRVGEFFPAIWQTWDFAQPVWRVRTIVLVLALALAIALPFAWCRFACPAGGVLAAVSRFSLFRVRKTAACNDCGVCQKVCRLDTRPEEINCLDCGDCIEACPQQCVGFGRKG